MSGGTTIALYDTLGPDAARFVCDQTELSTVCCSKDLVAGLVKLKEDDPEGKMAKLSFIVSFEDLDPANEADRATLDKAEALNVKVTTFD